MGLKIRGSNKCCEEAISALARKHVSCSLRNHNTTISGAILNKYYNVKTLQRHKQYKVCYNVIKTVKKKIQKRMAVDYNIQNTKKYVYNMKILKT